MIRLLAALFALLAFAAPAAAHEVRPALLTIAEAQSGTITVSFRQPIAGDGSGVRLEPHLSSGWLDREPDGMRRNEGALLRIWRIAEPGEPLAGQEIAIEGLENTITDTLVTIERSGGRKASFLLNASMPSTVLTEGGAGVGSGSGWVRLGIGHILSGFDHLAFVLGMLLLVRRWKALVLALTSFTLAHSITLALATLGVVHVPSRPVEAAIALSVAILAVEVVREARGHPGWLRGRPWLLAFPFGLLHGLGFAGALGAMGLDPDNILLPLLWFNLGVELGQLAFVAAVLALAWLVLRYAPAWLDRVRRALPYVIGPLAMVWLFQRLATQI
jgi:hydrogenase/urease accessory protein HupE